MKRNEGSKLCFTKVKRGTLAFLVVATSMPTTAWAASEAENQADYLTEETTAELSPEEMKETAGVPPSVEYGEIVVELPDEEIPETTTIHPSEEVLEPTSELSSQEIGEPVPEILSEKVAEAPSGLQSPELTEPVAEILSEEVAEPSSEPTLPEIAEPRPEIPSKEVVEPMPEFPPQVIEEPAGEHLEEEMAAITANLEDASETVPVLPLEDSAEEATPLPQGRMAWGGLQPYRIENGRAFFRTENRAEIPPHILEAPGDFNFGNNSREVIDEPTRTVTRNRELAESHAPNFRQLPSIWEEEYRVTSQRQSTTNRDEIPDWVRADPEGYGFLEQQLITGMPAVREVFTGRQIETTNPEDIPSRVLENPTHYNFRTEQRVREVWQETGVIASTTIMEEVPDWVVETEESQERYNFSETPGQSYVWLNQGIRHETEDQAQIPAWVLEDPDSYQFQSVHLRDQVIEGSRTYTLDEAEARSHQHWEEVDPEISYEEEKVFLEERVEAVLLAEVPAEVLTDPRYELRQTGYLWGDILQSPTHPGNQPNINIYQALRRGQVSLAELNQLEIPQVGAVVTLEGYDWEVTASDDGRANPIYGGGANVLGGSWNWNTISSIASSWGWNFPNLGPATGANAQPNRGLENGNAGVESQPAWWRFPVLPRHYNRTIINGQVRYTSTSSSPFNDPNISSDTIARAVELGYVYMTFNVTGNGSNPMVQWFKFLPSIEYNWSFELQRFEYQNGEPLYDWRESKTEQIAHETPRFAYWEEIPIYQYSWDHWDDEAVDYVTYSWIDHAWATEEYEWFQWDESEFVIEVAEAESWLFSWYTRSLESVEVPLFEYWETKIMSTFHWDIAFSDEIIEGEGSDTDPDEDLDPNPDEGVDEDLEPNPDEGAGEDLDPNPDEGAGEDLDPNPDEGADEDLEPNPEEDTGEDLGPDPEEVSGEEDPEQERPSLNSDSDKNADPDPDSEGAALNPETDETFHKEPETEAPTSNLEPEEVSPEPDPAPNPPKPALSRIRNATLPQTGTTTSYLPALGAGLLGLAAWLLKGFKKNHW